MNFMRKEKRYMKDRTIRTNNVIMFILLVTLFILTFYHNLTLVKINNLEKQLDTIRAGNTAIIAELRNTGG